MATTAASLSTALTGVNNDLDFTAVGDGADGNYISIKYVDPGVETATETVSVSETGGSAGGPLITVTLRSVSSTLSTAAQVKTAIEASARASALVTVANKAANDGTGVVTAMAAARLASGAWDGTTGGYTNKTTMAADHWRARDLDDGSVADADGETFYVAETFIDGCVSAQASSSANGLLSATAEYELGRASKGKAQTKV